MLDSINISEIWQSIVQWCGSIFWSVDTLYQIVALVMSAVIALLVYKSVKPHIKKSLEQLKLKITAQRIAGNVVKLVYPFTLLILTFIATQIAAIPALDYDTALLSGMMNVLVAWIVIRLAVQFIANSFIRNLFATIIWVLAALSIFGVLDHTMNALDALAFTVGDFRLSALAVIKSLLLIFTLMYIAIFVSSFAERRISKIQGLTQSSQVLISKIVRVTLIVVAILIGVTSAGIDLSLFAVFGGAIGLGIGFGLQKGISNLFSGMLLLMDRSIKPGDVIEIIDTGTFGWVNHMAARYTEIVTRDNKSFLIPNEDFITQRVVNWSHGDSLIRLQVHFGVHYDSDPHLVKKLAEEAAAKAGDRIAPDPSPVCWLIEFGDSSLNFTLRFWIKDAEAGVTNIKGQVMMALWDAFKENGIDIPYPHREVYMHEAGKKS